LLFAYNRIIFLNVNFDTTDASQRGYNNPNPCEIPPNVGFHGVNNPNPCETPPSVGFHGVNNSNNQQPIANSQLPTANCQQPTKKKNLIILF